MKPELRAFIDSAKIKKIPKNQAFVVQGEEAMSLFYIISGCVSVSLINQAGEEFIVATIPPGLFVGEMGLFGKEKLRSATLVAESELHVAEMTYPQFMHYIEDDIAPITLICEQMASRIADTTSNASYFVNNSTKERLFIKLKALASLPSADTENGWVYTKKTRHELGRMVGCTREHANNLVKELEREGKVKLKGFSIGIETDA
ncbi:cyclic nucleotide-binding domain-containing protein [Neptuniibacter sp. QD37_11]|uniref:cyclic nucleotide-binding domain-containing protein n=1 Tax=Neptuniibacter sp. QD37_11 TaxID=3398209 RepID=UPI0039F4A278